MFGLAVDFRLVGLVRLAAIELGLGLVGGFPDCGGLYRPAVVFGLYGFQLYTLAAEDVGERRGLGFCCLVCAGIGGARFCVGLGEGYGANAPSMQSDLQMRSRRFSSPLGRS